MRKSFMTVQWRNRRKGAPCVAAQLTGLLRLTRAAVLTFALWGAAQALPGSPPALGAGITDPEAVPAQASLPLQPPGIPFTDPVFGTTLLRATDDSDRGGLGTHIYSQLQAFSADNAYVLLLEGSGYVVRRLSDISQIEGMETAGWNAPRWHPVQPHIIIHFDSNEDTVVRVQYTDVDTLTTTTVFTFPARYERVFNNQSFDEISADGRWIAGALQRDDGAMVLFTLDLYGGALGAVLPVPALYEGACRPDPVWGPVVPDWVGVSTLGNYMMVQWARDGTDRCSGLESFDIQTGAFLGQAYDGHQHGDLGVLPDGTTEVFMTSVMSSPEDNNLPAIVLFELPEPERPGTFRLLRTIPWGDAGHISCQGPNGVCVVTTSPTGGAFDSEVYLQFSNGSVRRLVHHRSSECGYWVQPRASISRDGRYVIFASDWGLETGQAGCGPGDLGRGEAYIISLSQADIVPPESTTPPEPEPVPDPGPAPDPEPDPEPIPVPEPPPESMGEVLLYSTLDDSGSITAPQVGIGGSTTLGKEDFVPGQIGNGAAFSHQSGFVTFPAADGSSQNIELDKGEFELWYRPNYDAAADDVNHVLVAVGNVYDVPRLSLEEGDRLSLSVVTSDWITHSTRTGWRAPVWTAGQLVHIRAQWDAFHPTDSLRVYVNGARVDDGVASGGWNLGNESGFGDVFVGSADRTGTFNADGVIDELRIRGTVAGVSDDEDEPPTSEPEPEPQPVPVPLPTPVPSGRILLHSSLDDPASIAAPAAGLGGSSTLSTGSFMPGRVNNGASFTCDGCAQVVSFPIAAGDNRNVNLEQGELQFWYHPNYDAGADDINHVLVSIGNIYQVPRLVLEKSDRLWFSVTDGNWTGHATAAGYRAALWAAGEWVHVRAVWNYAHPTDSLRIYINGIRVDGGGVPGGWALGSTASLGRIFVGAGNADGDFAADGILDELVITEPKGDPLLYSSLDDPAAIAAPVLGLGGTTTLASEDFAPGQSSNGAKFSAQGGIVTFPAANSGGKNIDLNRGEIKKTKGSCLHS